MSRLFLAVLVALGFSNHLACASEEQPRLRVLASFLPVYCFAANVAGTLADVDSLLPANIEPHDYQFSRRDLQKLEQANIIVINGLGLEKWLASAIQNSAPGHAPRVVAISAGLRSELIFSSSPARVANPHMWLDPVLARHAVTNILKALQEADPAQAAGYSANATRYLTRLDHLDGAFRAALGPLRGSKLVTYHDAFAYFARRYGLDVVGVVEPVPDLEPSLKHLAGLYRSIRDHNISAIFTERSSPSRLARQMSADLHVPLAELDTLETGPIEPLSYENGMMLNLDALTTYLKPHAQTALR